MATKAGTKQKADEQTPQILDLPVGIRPRVSERKVTRWGKSRLPQSTTGALRLSGLLFISRSVMTTCPRRCTTLMAT
jgi:hypothetical protein